MKTKAIAIVALAALATIALGSCTQNDEPLTPATGFPADGVIRVATTVGEATTTGDATTRAGVTTPDLEKFYLNIENLSADYETKDKYSYFAAMHADAYNPGNWISFMDNEESILTMLWQNNTQTVSVTALYAYRAMWKQEDFKRSSPVSVSADQRTDAEVRKSDLLYMPPTVIDPATDLVGGKLPVRFDHLFSKLELTVKLGTEFNVVPGTATNPITNLKVNGTNLTVYFDPSTGKWNNALLTNAAAIAPFAGTFTSGSGSTSSALAKYEAIVIPQTVASGLFSVSFMIGIKEYTWTATAASGITFSQGSKHSLELVVGKDFVIAGTITTKKWGDGAEADVETE